MSIYGYVRVSSVDQNRDRQLASVPKKRFFVILYKKVQSKSGFFSLKLAINNYIMITATNDQKVYLLMLNYMWHFFCLEG